ncbi:MAG: hypothetical protein EOO54_20980 [Haliea sp.]|nr:MAG: hypothetical protein EOO54_20980 [Haliea sp.]
MKRSKFAAGAIAVSLAWGFTAAIASVVPDDGALSVSPTDATQMRLRPGGIGHQLIVPYYTAQNGNATFLNIVNTDGVNGKAVKIRFRSGMNADIVLDFQLYLSPGDVWVATLSQGSNGRALLTTNDKSCSLPLNVGAGAGQSFLTSRLPSEGDAELASLTREGYVEIITMANIPAIQPAADGSVSAASNPLFTAIKHVAGVAPCTPATLNGLATDPQTTSAAYAMGLRAPTASLLANWIILDIPRSAASSGEAMAIIAAGADNAPARGNMVFFPQAQQFFH